MHCNNCKKRATRYSNARDGKVKWSSLFLFRFVGKKSLQTLLKRNPRGVEESTILRNCFSMWLIEALNHLRHLNMKKYQKIRSMQDYSSVTRENRGQLCCHPDELWNSLDFKLTCALYQWSGLYTEHIVGNKTTAKGLTQALHGKKCHCSSQATALLKSFLCNPSFTFPLILNHSKCSTHTETTAALDFCLVDLSCVHSREKKAPKSDHKTLQCTSLWCRAVAYLPFYQ